MRPRTTILLGVILLLGVGVFLILSSQTGGDPEAAEVDTPVPTPVIPTVQIVVSAQNIPRGRLITEDSVTLVDWPLDSVPPGAFETKEDVLNLTARTDILFNQPLTGVMLTNDRAQLVQRGSDAALLIPNDKRGFAMPIDQLASVAYAILPGDHVDVIVSLWIVDVNRDGQYPVVPLDGALVDQLITSGLEPAEAIQSVISSLADAKVFDRLSSQIILQDIEILVVGNWVDPTPVPPFTPGVPVAEEFDPEAPPVALAGTPTVTPPRPNVVVLSVTPQQALILQWLRESDAILDLALRGPTDRAPSDTETVTLQYLFDNFNVTVAPKLDFAIDFIGAEEGPPCPDRWTKDSCR